MEMYCIVIRKENAKIEQLSKCVEGQVLGVNDPGLYLHTTGTEEQIATFALDKGCDMKDFESKLNDANSPEI